MVLKCNFAVDRKFFQQYLEEIKQNFKVPMIFVGSLRLVTLILLQVKACRKDMDREKILENECREETGLDMGVSVGLREKVGHKQSDNRRRDE